MNGRRLIGSKRRYAMEQIEKLREIVNGSSNIVFFGGAGVSTESGIPDFRSVDGLYHQKYDYPPERHGRRSQDRHPASVKCGRITVKWERIRSYPFTEM